MKDSCFIQIFLLLVLIPQILWGEYQTTLTPDNVANAVDKRLSGCLETKTTSECISDGQKFSFDEVNHQMKVFFGEIPTPILEEIKDGLKDQLENDGIELEKAGYVQLMNGINNILSGDKNYYFDIASEEYFGSVDDGAEKTKDLLKKLKKNFKNLQGHISAHAYINGKCVSQKVSEKKLNRDLPGFKEEVNKLTLECTDKFDIQSSFLGELKKKRTGGLSSRTDKPEGTGVKGKSKTDESSSKKLTDGEKVDSCKDIMTVLPKNHPENPTGERIDKYAEFLVDLEKGRYTPSEAKAVKKRFSKCIDWCQLNPLMREKYPVLCANNREGQKTNISLLPDVRDKNSGGNSHESYYCNELWNESWKDRSGKMRTSRNLTNEDICPVINGNNLIHFQEDLKKILGNIGSVCNRTESMNPLGAPSSGIIDVCGKEWENYNPGKLIGPNIQKWFDVSQSQNF